MNDEYIERGEKKLEKLLNQIEEKKRILERILRDGEDLINKLEYEIEDEKRIKEEEENEFDKTMIALDEINEKIKQAEEELNSIENEIFTLTNSTEKYEKIQSLEKELLSLKATNKELKENNRRKLQFFFFPFNTK